MNDEDFSKFGVKQVKNWLIGKCDSPKKGTATAQKSKEARRGGREG